MNISFGVSVYNDATWTQMFILNNEKVGSFIMVFGTILKQHERNTFPMSKMFLRIYLGTNVNNKIYNIF